MDLFLGINRFMLRITKDCPINEIENLIISLHLNKYIIGSELSGKGRRHFHIYMEGVITRDKIKAYLNENGYKGNQAYNLKDADNNNKVKKYCVKDGEYVYHGVSPELIEAWVKLSHKKVSPQYDEELHVLETKYIQNESYDELEFGTDYLKLGTKYGKKPIRHHFVPYINNLRIKKHPGYARTLSAHWLDIFL